MRVKNNKFLYALLCVFSVLLLFSLVTPAAVSAAPGGLLEITGDGIANPVAYTREQLEKMPQRQHVYSAINTWPTKKWYVGRGVYLRDLFKEAGIKEDASMVKFTSSDSYVITLTVKELLDDKRYCFPHFMDKNAADGDGNIAGSTANAVPVEPMIALLSVEGSDNPAYMNDLNVPLLMLGQRAVTEQTGNLFVKYLCKIEVTTGEPPRWDAPRANPDSGVAPKGTMVALSNENMDDDKVYYTTDGSTPTLNSPMYNWIARRWWSARSDVLGNYNKPVGPINENTVIKAMTIGPGKKNSEVATFTYRVAVSGPAEEKQAVSNIDAERNGARNYIQALSALGVIEFIKAMNVR